MPQGGWFRLLCRIQRFYGGSINDWQNTSTKVIYAMEREIDPLSANERLDAIGDLIVSNARIMNDFRYQQYLRALELATKRGQQDFVPFDISKQRARKAGLV